MPLRKTVNNKKAFTLAEVLLTLTIIGVVAMLTIPNMIQNTNNAPMKLAWKQAYSIISQVGYQMRDNTETNSIKGLCPDNGANCFKSLFINYVSYIKSANVNQSYGNCWTDYKYLNGASGTNWNPWMSCLALNNGMFFMFSWPYANCQYDGETGGTVRMCGFITVDVNGFKAPNTLGIDIFQAYVMENRTLPAGIAGSGSDMNTCTPSAEGWSCAYEYLKQ